jgi:DNA-binding MarR family transcriptional regulator
MLQRMRSTLGDHPAEGERAADEAELTWDDFGLVSEGLAFAVRPLRRATVEITRRYDLGPRGAWMLNLINNGLRYPTEISAMFSVGRSLITAELARLTEAGLVTSRPGEQDRRKTELALTAEGEAACAAIRDSVAEIIRTHLAGYSNADIRKFAQMLRDVRGDITKD